jgi:hypothetical protein
MISLANLVNAPSLKLLQRMIQKLFMHLPNMTTLDHKFLNRDNRMTRNSSKIGFLNQHDIGSDTMKIKI